MQRFVSWRAPWMEEDRAHADWQTGREIGVMLIGSTVVRGFSALAGENALGEQQGLAGRQRVARSVNTGIARALQVCSCAP